MKIKEFLWLYCRMMLFPLCLLFWFIWKDQYYIYVMGISGFVYAITDYLHIKNNKMVVKKRIIRKGVLRKLFG